MENLREFHRVGFFYALKTRSWRQLRISTRSLTFFAIKVTGHPTEGADATNEFKLTVAKE